MFQKNFKNNFLTHHPPKNEGHVRNFVCSYRYRTCTKFVIYLVRYGVYVRTIKFLVNCWIFFSSVWKSKKRSEDMFEREQVSNFDAFVLTIFWFHQIETWLYQVVIIANRKKVEVCIISSSLSVNLLLLTNWFIFFNHDKDWSYHNFQASCWYFCIRLTTKNPKEPLQLFLWKNTSQEIELFVKIL